MWNRMLAVAGMRSCGPIIACGRNRPVLTRNVGTPTRVGAVLEACAAAVLVGVVRLDSWAALQIVPGTWSVNCAG